MPSHGRSGLGLPPTTCGRSARGAAAGLHAGLRLLGRLRHAQRLADIILIPLHDLKRLVDRVITANKPRRRGGGGRG